MNDASFLLSLRNNKIPNIRKNSSSVFLTVEDFYGFLHRNVTFFTVYRISKN